MNLSEYNNYCRSKVPPGFHYVPCHIFVHSVPCIVRRDKGVKKPIHHAAMVMHAALEAAGIKVIHRDVDDRKSQADIWCDASFIER